MAKSNIGTPSVEFPKGGSTSMFGTQSAGSQVEGTTGHSVKGDGGKFAVGGKGHMFGQGSANKAEAGRTAKGSQ